MITILNKEIQVTSLIPGSDLKDFIRECITFCSKYGVEVKASFNGYSHTITKFTDYELIYKNWFK